MVENNASITSSLKKLLSAHCYVLAYNSFAKCPIFGCTCISNFTGLARRSFCSSHYAMNLYTKPTALFIFIIRQIVLSL